MKSFFRTFFLGSLVSLAFLTQMFAQGGATGAISGVVQDPSSAVIANAQVSIVNQDTGVLARTTTTDATGNFSATLLPAGNYTVGVKSAGFAEGKFTDIVVRITETTRLTARLAPQSVKQAIQVEAQV